MSDILKNIDKEWLKEKEKHIKEILKATGCDMEHPGIQETPKRMIKALFEMTSGYKDNPKKYLKFFPDNSNTLTMVKDIQYNSLCMHHILPFSGYISFAYIPDGQVLGLSKFKRITDCFSKRLQIQESLTRDIFDFLKNNIPHKYLAVYTIGKHDCISCRGALAKDSHTECLYHIDKNKTYFTYNDIYNLLKKEVK